MNRQWPATFTDDPAAVLAHYGELAVELEDTEDPAHADDVHDRLLAMDGMIDAMATSAIEPPDSTAFRDR